MLNVSQMFISAINEGPDYICTCCHRLMYRKTVVLFDLAKYSKLSGELRNNLFPSKYLRVSVKGEVWVCKTCHFTLQTGKMPAQAKANTLELEDIPPEVSDLNSLEVRLISLRIPFMKMVALSSGKQRAIRGPAVNVPTDLQPICSLLPRLPSQAQMVPMY